MQPDRSSDNTASGGPPAPQHDSRALMDEIENLEGRFSGLLERYVPLADLTTFRIGGPALALCRIKNVDDARRFQEISLQGHIPTFSLGGGSNVLADDRGYAGIVSRMEDTSLTIEGNLVRVGAGLKFDELIRRTLAAGLSGLEFASGIPGSIGGAVVGNAGCFGHEISEFLVEARVLDPQGDLRVLGPEDLDFSYRHSGLQETGALLLEISFGLEHGDLAAAAKIREQNLALRREKHPVDLPTAGSYFKNLPALEEGGRRRAAGQLLEEAGAAGLSCGDAAVFEKHANIIVNRGEARCTDVLELARRMRRMVRDKFGIELEAEVRHIRWTAED